MKITHYEFGKIKVDDKMYTSDIKIYNNNLVSNWWREEGHKLSLEDIKDILETNPEVIIVGSGAYSVLEVSEEVKKYCKEKNIQLIVENTYDAVKKFNSMYSVSPRTTAGCFHLTC